jgi:hypothetical protein
MQERTESRTWTVFEMTHAEFCRRLGIPEELSVVTVRANAYSDQVEITATERRP